MKAARLQSSCPEENGTEGLFLSSLSFLGKGPYTITLKPGECVGLTGPSGVGKTQLLRAVADLIGHEGDCFLDGISCLSMPPPEWRKMVAMIPAESFWWYDTVGAHFDGNDGLTKIFHLREKFGFPPDVMEWQISRLSTGERQRLSLLRTLITEPKVLLLDEPTSALDKKMAHVVEEVLAGICSASQTSSLWVSHDLEQLFRVSDRVFRVESTGLVEEKAK